MNDTHRIVVYTPVTDALYNGGMLIPLIGLGCRCHPVYLGRGWCVSLACQLGNDLQ